MNRLRHLQDAGVSIWLDDLSRDLLDSGEFMRMIREQSVTGATSNPTIFAKAISDTERYDRQLRLIVESGHTRSARDLLRAGFGRRPPGRRCPARGL